jgi:PIN domain nuclease of toxin-antitoxin system
LIVLDTHTWIWWNAEPDKLSGPARQAIDDADEVGICPISCWELAMLVSKGRLKLDRAPLEWTNEALSDDFCKLIPISPVIAVTAGSLEGFHGDPADRLIVATAIEMGVPLITRDRKIRDFGRVDALW